MGRFPDSRFLLAALGLSAAGAQAASLSEMMDAVPPPPDNVALALSWTQDGQIVAPEYTAIRKAIKAEMAAIEALNGGPLPDTLSAPSPGPDEAPEVRGAALALQQYLASHSGKAAPSAAVGKRARWLHAAMSGRLGAVLGQMTPCTVPCTDEAALASNQPLQLNRSSLARQDIDQWGALFDDWVETRSPLVGKGQALIAATGEGSAARTAAGRSAIAQFRAALLREVEAALSITELAVRRAFAIQTVDVDAVSGSTYAPPRKAASRS